MFTKNIVAYVRYSCSLLISHPRIRYISIGASATVWAKTASHGFDNRSDMRSLCVCLCMVSVSVLVSHYLQWHWVVLKFSNIRRFLISCDLLWQTFHLHERLLIMSWSQFLYVQCLSTTDGWAVFSFKLWREFFALAYSLLWTVSHFCAHYNFLEEKSHFTAFLFEFEFVLVLLCRWSRILWWLMFRNFQFFANS